MIQGQQGWLVHPGPVEEDWAKMTSGGFGKLEGVGKTRRILTPVLASASLPPPFSTLLQLMNQSSFLLYLVSEGTLAYRIPIPFLVRKKYGEGK